MATKAQLEEGLKAYQEDNRKLRNEIEDLKSRVPTSREEVANMIEEAISKHYNWYHKKSGCQCCGN